MCRRLALGLLAAVIACSADPPGGDGGLDAATVSGIDGAVGTPDAAPIDTGVAPNPHNPSNDTRDSDCDGLSDEEEFSTIWPGNLKTDPAKADTDGDGVPDGIEIGRTASVDAACTGFSGDADPASKTDPTRPDSDGDGLPDGTEDVDHDGRVNTGRETDPRRPDTDGDGLCDGPMDVIGVCRGGDPTPTVQITDTDLDGVPDGVDLAPNNPDGDGDKLCDGALAVAGICESGEDLDGNGTRGAAETDPARIDTDCDGLVDGPSYGAFKGERTLGTNPTEPDTDGDGLIDGLEAGVGAAPDPSCMGLMLDVEPGTTTNPTMIDTDGDGIPDGAEDSNQNGRHDMGELDPNDRQDGLGDPSVTAACAADRLVPVDRARSFPPDLQVVTAVKPTDAFAETSEITSPSGRVIGRMAYNAQLQVAYLVLTSTPTGADVGAEERALRTRIDGVGNITTPLTKLTTTWDGYPALQASYNMGGRQALKARANAIAVALEPGARTLLPTAGDVPAVGYRVRATFIRRSPRTSVWLVAVAPLDRISEATEIAVDDMGGGSALGQHSDGIGVTCDRFVSAPDAKIDILWAVDNSASMAEEQGAVAASAAALDARLSGASIDWRTAVVTSGFWRPGNGMGCDNTRCAEAAAAQCRPFTTNIARFGRWFTQTSTSWIGAGGPCNQPNEQIAFGAQLLLSPSMMGVASAMPPQAMPDARHLRADTNLVLILMGDADDQHYDNAGAAAGTLAYETFFRGLPVQSITVGGILCPVGETCGETHRTPRVAQALVDRFGGVIGSLNDLASIGPTVAAIIDDAVGNVSPYVLSKNAIASTLKVGMEPGATRGACAVDDVPRSRVNGFDYDAEHRTLIFYGDCRPKPDMRSRIAVSYRSWIEASPASDPAPCTSCGTCPGQAVCDPMACACMCEERLSCSPGTRWDAQACDCVCDVQSLGCDAQHQADPTLCACTCKSDCGGCETLTVCQTSLCVCTPLDL